MTYQIWPAMGETPYSKLVNDGMERRGEHGSIHVTCSYNTKAIKHAHFDEAWVQEGDAK